MAVVGPFNGSVATAQIPISNVAGLLQCTPSSTLPSLTEGTSGKLLRSAHPAAINFVRVLSPDDRQGTALADFASQQLHRQRAVVIDDGGTYGAAIAKTFDLAWAQRHGTVALRMHLAGSLGNVASLVTEIKAAKPDVVLFAGLTSSGAGTLRAGLTKAGLGKVPFLGPDGILDGSATDQGSFIADAGTGAAGSYASVSGLWVYPGQDAFRAKYQAAYGSAPGSYAANGYACAQVVIAAIRHAVAAGSLTRDAVRAAAVDPRTSVDTILGPIQYNAVGDLATGAIAIYKAAPSTGGGAADWAFLEEVTVH
jgi:branched-chain amino acid transport system substrate-binding protein